MARPQRRRRICREPEYRHFQPDGITAGLSATTFGPASNCNRAQIVTFLYRAYAEA